MDCLVRGNEFYDGHWHRVLIGENLIGRDQLPNTKRQLDQVCDDECNQGGIVAKIWTPISKKSRKEINGRTPQRCSHFLGEENTLIVPSTANTIRNDEEDDNGERDWGICQHQLTNPVVLEPTGLSKAIAVHCLWGVLVLLVETVWNWFIDLNLFPMSKQLETSHRTLKGYPWSIIYLLFCTWIIMN